MSCSKVQPLQNSLNNPFKDIPAGKPTAQPDNSDFMKIYHEPSTMEFKTSKRNINHRNKTSMFDISYAGIKEQAVNSIDHTNSDIQDTLKKRFIQNSSLNIYNMHHGDTKNEPNEKGGKRTTQDIRNLYLFSKEYCKKISSYSLEKNPYKWGVDVLKYSLPSPKKMHRHVDNLSSCLVPNISEDSFIPKKKISHYVTQLEKSLCPKEDVSIPNSSKKLINPHESKLEVNYVPKDLEGKRILNKSEYYQGNLNTDLIPMVENNRKSFHINTTCRNKKCSISFGDTEPSPFRPGKRIGYVCTQNEDPIFLF